MGQYANTITGCTPIHEILTILPSAKEVLARYGIHCASCSMNATETLEEGCHNHHMTNEDREDLMADLILLHKELPPRPPSVTITKEAALLLKKIMMDAESPLTCAIIINEHQQCALEMSPQCKGDHVFSHADVPDVRLTVTPFLLSYVGGAILSVKNGRLTIDLPDVRCCGEKESCSCS